MAEFDPGLESRVWQRVLGEGPGREQNDGSMLYREAEAENAYRHLSRRMPEQAEAFRRMAAQAQHHGAVLRGIRKMRDQDSASPQLPAPGSREPLTAALRKCYHRAMELENEYRRREENAEYGCVYAQLRRQEEDQMLRLLGILGSLGTGSRFTAT